MIREKKVPWELWDKLTLCRYLFVFRIFGPVALGDALIGRRDTMYSEDASFATIAVTLVFSSTLLFRSDSLFVCGIPFILFCVFLTTKTNKIKQTAAIGRAE